MSFKIAALDDGVGKVVNALKENQMLQNSVILFFCDNGAPIEQEHSNGGSNSPFKGVKVFECLYRWCSKTNFFLHLAKAITLGRRCTFSWCDLESFVTKPRTNIQSTFPHYRLGTNIRFVLLEIFMVSVLVN